MTPRLEDDTLTESELGELKRNLLLLSGTSVENFYRDAHRALCEIEHFLAQSASQRIGNNDDKLKALQLVEGGQA